MVGDIARIRISKLEKEEFIHALSNWHTFINWIRQVEDDKLAFKCMVYEIRGACRPHFIDRARTRYNKLRAYRELKELENHINMVISVNHLG